MELLIFRCGRGFDLVMNDGFEMHLLETFDKILHVYYAVQKIAADYPGIAVYAVEGTQYVPLEVETLDMQQEVS